MKKPKYLDSVRKLDEPEGSPDQYAKVNSVYEDGSVWVANLNMPYMGSISKVYPKEEFEKTFEVIS